MTTRGVMPEDKNINVAVDHSEAGWLWITMDGSFVSAYFETQEQANADADANGFFYREPQRPRKQLFSETHSELFATMRKMRNEGATYQAIADHVSSVLKRHTYPSQVRMDLLEGVKRLSKRVESN